MKKYAFFLTVVALFGALVFAQAVQAEEAADMITAQVLEDSAALADEPEVLDGVTVEEPTNIPSGFGLWWQNLREQVALGLTFDSVKKAEKQLAFAADRIKLAEYMLANSTDAKVQERAQALLERSGAYMEKIRLRQTELFKNAGQEQRAQMLLKNAAKNQLNSELAFEKLEDKLPADKLEAFQAWRSETEAKQNQLLQAMQSAKDLPQELKDKAAEIQARIKTKLEERSLFRVQQQELLDQIKAGKEEARAALGELVEEKQQAVEQAREEYQTAKEAIVNKINAGETNAVKELLQLNEERKAEVKNIIQTVNTKAVEIKTELKNTTQTIQQDLQQNRVQQQTQTKPAVSPATNSTMGL